MDRDELIERLNEALKMDAPAASDREWTDLLAVTIDAAAVLTADAATIARLEAELSAAIAGTEEQP